MIPPYIHPNDHHFSMFYKKKSKIVQGFAYTCLPHIHQGITLAPRGDSHPAQLQLFLALCMCPCHIFSILSADLFAGFKFKTS